MYFFVETVQWLMVITTIAVNIWVTIVVRILRDIFTKYTQSMLIILKTHQYTRLGIHFIFVEWPNIGILVPDNCIEALARRFVEILIVFMYEDC